MLDIRAFDIASQCLNNGKSPWEYSSDPYTVMKAFEYMEIETHYDAQGFVASIDWEDILPDYESGTSSSTSDADDDGGEWNSDMPLEGGLE